MNNKYIQLNGSTGLPLDTNLILYCDKWSSGFRFDLLQNDKLIFSKDIDKNETFTINHILFKKIKEKCVNLPDLDLFTDVSNFLFYISNNTTVRYIEPIAPIYKKSNDFVIKDSQGKITGISLNQIANYIMEQEKFITLNDVIWHYDRKENIYKNNAIQIIGEISKRILEGSDQYNTYKEYQIIHSIKRETYMENVEPPINLIRLDNNDYDWMTEESYPLTSDHFFTSKLTYPYNPHATCEKFEKFMIDTFPDEKRRNFVLDYVGFGFLRRYKYKKFLILKGLQNTGKTTFLNTITELYGRNNVSNTSLANMSSGNIFYTSELYNKLANIDDEVPKKPAKYTNLIKKLTGESGMAHPRKRLESIQFTNYAKLYFACNDLPPIYDLDDAFLDRMELVICENVILEEKINRNLGKELITPESLSGIFNLAMEHLRNLESRNHFDLSILIKGEDKERELTIDEKRELYTKLSDILTAFLDEKTKKSDSKNDFISKEKFYIIYCDYCKDRGVVPLSDNILGKRVKALGIPQGERTVNGKDRTPCWIFITWK